MINVYIPRSRWPRDHETERARIISLVNCLFIAFSLRIKSMNEQLKSL